MKKMIFTVVALMSMTMTFAENESAANMNTTESYNMTVNMDKLTKALGLSDDQVEAVSEIHKSFSAEMMFGVLRSSVCISLALVHITSPDIDRT